MFVFLVLFLFRNSILSHFTQNITKQLSKKYNVQFIVKNSEFIGLKTTEFSEIYVVDSTKNDTLFSTQRILAEIGHDEHRNFFVWTNDIVHDSYFGKYQSQRYKNSFG